MLKPYVYCIVDSFGHIKRYMGELKFYENRQRAEEDCYMHNFYFAEQWRVVKCELVEVQEDED